MAELAPRERLQPSLLDRLTDDEPDHQVEARERRVLSMRGLRDGVLRDLAWLLNTTNLLSVSDVPRLPHLASSVLNYGMPDMSGASIACMRRNAPSARRSGTSNRA
jgi:type VI secretion system protein ImpF